MENCDFIPYELYEAGVKSKFWSNMSLIIHDDMACISESSRLRMERNLMEEEQRLRSVPQGERVDMFSQGVESFLPELGEDIVLTSLWPKLMDGSTKVANFQTCCHLRSVCSGWKKFVEDRDEWQKGLLSWSAGEHRSWQVLPVEYVECLQRRTDSESAESEDGSEYEEDIALGSEDEVGIDDGSEDEGEIAPFWDEAELESQSSQNDTRDM